MSTIKTNLKGKEEFIDAIDAAIKNNLEVQNEEETDAQCFAAFVSSVLLSRVIEILYVTSGKSTAKLMLLFEVSSKVALTHFLENERNEEKNQ